MSFQPVSRSVEELKEGDSVLKIQLRAEAKTQHFPTGPSNVDLQNLFYTNKHIWYSK